jgi:hypothetical protein
MDKNEHVIEYDCECESCKGTGLYQGMGERVPFAVVCYRCKGTGKRHEKITYRDFINRKVHDNVKQVVECNPGICLGMGKDSQFTLDSFGGMRYLDWLKSKPFPVKSEMRQFTCPAWWYQAANYELKPEWCHEYGFYCGEFSGCKQFQSKVQCWERFDKEHSIQ